MKSRSRRAIAGFGSALALCMSVPALAAAAPATPQAFLASNGVTHRVSSPAALSALGARWLIAVSPQKVIGYTNHASYLRALRQREPSASRPVAAHTSALAAAFFYSDIHYGGCVMTLGYSARAADLRSWYRCNAGNWNDQISSITTVNLSSYYTMVYGDIYYGGGSVALAPGYYYPDLRSLGFQPWNINDQISSIAVCPC